MVHRAFEVNELYATNVIAAGHTSTMHSVYPTSPQPRRTADTANATTAKPQNDDATDSPTTPLIELTPRLDYGQRHFFERLFYFFTACPHSDLQPARPWMGARDC